jgi:hypothetical protein
LFSKVVEIYVKETFANVKMDEIENKKRNNAQLIKIKEDAIDKILRHDIDDTIRDINNENVKCFYILLFSSALLGIVLGKVDIMSKLQEILLSVAVILLLGSIFISFYNIGAKEIAMHIKIEKIFQENRNITLEEYLSEKYKVFEECYNEAQGYLHKKAQWTKIASLLSFASATSMFWLKFYKYTRELCGYVYLYLFTALFLIPFIIFLVSVLTSARKSK